MDPSSTEIITLTGLAIAIIAAIAQIVVVPSRSQRAGLTILLIAAVGFLCLNYRRDFSQVGQAGDSFLQGNQKPNLTAPAGAPDRQGFQPAGNDPHRDPEPRSTTDQSSITLRRPDLKSLLVGTWRLAEINGKPAKTELTHRFHSNGTVTISAQSPTYPIVLHLLMENFAGKGRYFQIDDGAIRIETDTLIGRFARDIRPIFDGSNRVRWRAGTDYFPEEWLLIRE